MSDGICNIASGDFVELKDWHGLGWKLSCKTLDNFAEIERFILGRRGDPLRAVLDWVNDLPADQRGLEIVARQVDSALRMHMRARFASQDEIWEYNNAPAGMGHRLWLAARESHPDMTLERCTVLVLRSDPANLRRLSHALDGVDETEKLKNSDGPENAGAG